MIRTMSLVLGIKTPIMGILSLVMVTQALVIRILTLEICIETLMMGTKNP